jgi:hypothetical protein
MPAVEPGDTIRLAAQDLIPALQQKHSKAPINLEPHHTAALCKLAEIFETVTEVDAPEPRVKDPSTEGAALGVQEPSTSHDATAPRVLLQTRPIHQQHTRNNSPVQLQNDNERDDDATVKASNVKTANRTNNRFEKQVQQRAVQRKHQEDEADTIEQAIKELEAFPKPPPTPATRPRRTVAQYRAKREATKVFETAQPVPITQDDDFANAVMGTMRRVYSMATPCGITQHAIYHMMGAALEQDLASAFIPGKFAMQQTYNVPNEHFANAVVHPVTKETITKYEKVANDPVTRDVWTKAFCKELGRLAQGYGGTIGTETIFFMSHKEIKAIPKDRTVTYA